MRRHELETKLPNSRQNPNKFQVLERTNSIGRIVMIGFAYGVQIATQPVGKKEWTVTGWSNSCNAHDTLATLLKDSPGAELYVDNRMCLHSSTNKPRWDARGPLDAYDIVTAGWAETAKQVLFSNGYFSEKQENKA